MLEIKTACEFCGMIIDLPITIEEAETINKEYRSINLCSDCVNDIGYGWFTRWLRKWKRSREQAKDMKARKVIYHTPKGLVDLNGEAVEIS